MWNSRSDLVRFNTIHNPQQCETVPKFSLFLNIRTMFFHFLWNSLNHNLGDFEAVLQIDLFLFLRNMKIHILMQNFFDHNHLYDFEGYTNTYSTVLGIHWSSLTKGPLTGSFTICCWWHVAMIQWLCCLGCVFYSHDVHEIFLCTAHVLMYVTEWKCMSSMGIWSISVKVTFFRI